MKVKVDTNGYRYVRQEQIRKAFWQDIFDGKKPKTYYGLKHNELPPEIQELFTMFVDDLQKDKSISPDLAKRVTL